jgi:hypothetical protein
MNMEHFVERKLARKLKYSEKTCTNANLSTKNPTSRDLGSNPSTRGGMPATNHPSLWRVRGLYLLIWQTLLTPLVSSSINSGF